ncbi:MAG: hypothetical protein ACODAU_05880 [Myxococcota bacterium]
MSRARWLAFLIVVSALVPDAARADEMDLTLEDLDRFDPQPGREFAWRSLVSQLGATMAPPVLEPAHTVGPGGFYLGVETWVTGIDDDEEYWGYGTEGDDVFADYNRFTRSTYTWFRLNVRKGLPYGFELGASAGHALHTTYWTWGFTLKLALLEGFRTGVGYAPDIAIRASVQTLTGDSELNLTVPSIDLILSKPFTVAKTAQLTPFVAGQAMWMLGDSEVVDMSPGTNAYDVCDPGTPQQSFDNNEQNPGDPARNTTVCNGDPSDFDNNHVFDQVRALRTRLTAGLQYQYMALTLTASFAIDLLKPGQLDDDVATYDELTGTDGAGNPETEQVTNRDLLPRQWTVSVGAGLTY